MASNITKISDYYGETFLVNNNQGDQANFNDFVETTEKRILRGNGVDDYGLLGDHIYLALIADLDVNNDPQNAPYINLVNGTTYIGANGTNLSFCGIREMLTYFVYSDYIKNNLVLQSGVGSIQFRYKYGEQVQRKNVNRHAHINWNKGVDLYNNEVFQYLLFYQSNFPNWQFTKQYNYLTMGIK